MAATACSCGGGAARFDERRYEPFGTAIDSYSEQEGIPDVGAIGPVNFRRDPQNILNKKTDPNTGWSYHGARWLAPQTTQWLTPDPPVKAPDPKFMSKPWGLHPYQYVDQNPNLFWDPDGREKQGGGVVAANDVPTTVTEVRNVTITPIDASKPFTIKFGTFFPDANAANDRGGYRYAGYIESTTFGLNGAVSR